MVTPRTPRGSRGWDRVAGTYRWQEPLEAAGWQVALAHAAAGPGDRVVDLGCGTGVLARRLARRPPLPRRRPVGVDSSVAMLRRARAAGERVVAGDVTAVPLADAVADLVVAGWVLHVLDAAQRRAAVAEVARLLAPGGRAVLLVPARPTTPPGRALRALSHALVGSLEPPDDLDEAVAAAGLAPAVDVRVGGVPGYATRVLLVRAAPGVAAGPASQGTADGTTEALA